MKLERRLPAKLAFAAACAAALPACSGDMNPVRDVFVATGVGAKPKEAPEFIAQSRPGQVDYMPVGVTAPARSPAKPASGVKAVEAQMDAVRAANEARAAEARAVGATPPPAVPVVKPIE